MKFHFGSHTGCWLIKDAIALVHMKGYHIDITVIVGRHKNATDYVITKTKQKTFIEKLIIYSVPEAI